MFHRLPQTKIVAIEKAATASTRRGAELSIDATLAPFHRSVPNVLAHPIGSISWVETSVSGVFPMRMPSREFTLREVHESRPTEEDRCRGT